MVEYCLAAKVLNGRPRAIGLQNRSVLWGTVHGQKAELIALGELDSPADSVEETVGAKPKMPAECDKADTGTDSKKAGRIEGPLACVAEAGDGCARPRF